MICTTTNTIFIPVGVMYLHARMFSTLTDMISVPISAICSHARTFCTLNNTTFIPADAIYLRARMFCTPSDRIFIPMGALYLRAKPSVHSLIRLLYPGVWCVYLQAQSVCLWVRFTHKRYSSVIFLHKGVNYLPARINFYSDSNFYPHFQFLPYRNQFLPYRNQFLSR